MALAGAAAKGVAYSEREAKEDLHLPRKEQQLAEVAEEGEIIYSLFIDIDINILY